MKFIKVALLNTLFILFLYGRGYSQNNVTIHVGEELSKTHSWETTDSKCYGESSYTLEGEHTANWVDFNVDRNSGEILFTGSTLEPGLYTVSYKNHYDVEVLDRCEPEIDKVSFEITVQNSAPKINSSANKNAKEGSRYSYSVNANDPNGHDLNYNLVNGPKWLSLSDKTLSGTPGYDQSGTYGIKIKVDDGYGGVDTQSFTLTVSNVNRPPSIDSSPPTSAI